MPSKGKSPVTPGQRGRIAAGRLAGKTSATIAEETGLSESTVRKQGIDPRTSVLILRLKARDEERLERGWNLAIQTILKDLGSKHPTIVREARRDFLRYLTAGDPSLAVARITPNEPGRGDFTLEELLIAYRKATDGDGS